MWEKPEHPELTQMSSIYSEKMLFSPTTHGPACAPTSDEARLKDFRFHAVNKWYEPECIWFAETLPPNIISWQLSCFSLGSWGFKRLGFRWMRYMKPLCVGNSSVVIIYVFPPDVFCCSGESEAPEMFCGLCNFTWLPISIRVMHKFESLGQLFLMKLLWLPQKFWTWLLSFSSQSMSEVGNWCWFMSTPHKESNLFWFEQGGSFLTLETQNCSEVCLRHCCQGSQMFSTNVLLAEQRAK